jgi:hypothetical protein
LEKEPQSGKSTYKIIGASPRFQLTIDSYTQAEKLFSIMALGTEYQSKFITILLKTVER